MVCLLIFLLKLLILVCTLDNHFFNFITDIKSISYHFIQNWLYLRNQVTLFCFYENT